MPLTGQGIIPGGAAGTQLQAMTRRAFLPAVIVQIGKSTVTLSSLLSAAEPISGGVSPVTIPVQGSRMVSGAFTDYSGSFSTPQVLTGLFNAEYNLKAWVVGIPYYLFEGMVQIDAEVVPILWARMNDAGNYTSDQLATFLWNAESVNTALQPWSINDVIATTDPTQGALGNLAVATYTWWVANSATITSITSGVTAVSRTTVLAALNYAQKNSGGEPPSCGLCSPGFWTALAADTLGNERYLVTKEGSYAEAGEGATIGFPAINIGGIPIYADPYITDNTKLWLPNFNYLGFKMHEDAAFALAGPESLLPQFQLGYIMALVALLELTCSKRAAQSIVTGFTGAYSI